MEAFVGLALVAIGVAIFVALVRRTNRKGAALMAQSKPWEAHKPQPLSSAQRKRLELGSASPSPSDQPVRRAPDHTAAPSRAMRTGWRLGEVAFTYEDSVGDVTYRTVTVHSVTATYLKGECHDRQAERTFKIERIIGDVVDLDTGEILRPRSLARHLA